MATPIIQSQLNAGELSPSLYGRVDLAKYREGCATLRNMWASYKGGASSRAGTKFVGVARQTSTDSSPQLIPFQYSVDQGYLLVFSNQEMSVVANGAYVLRDPFTVSAVTNAPTAVITAAGNDFTTTDWVYFSGLGGLTDLNGQMFAIDTIPTTGSFSVKDILTGVTVSTVTSSAYTTGGTVAKLFVLSTPYVSADLQGLKWAQSADVMSLTHPNYPPMDLARVAVNNWTLTTTSFSASIAAPTVATASGTVMTVTFSQATQYSYEVTAIDSSTGQESIASPAAAVNNSVNIATTLGSVKVTWAGVTGAQYYNIYKATPVVAGAVPVGALYGFAGTAFGLTFQDTNITQDFNVTPPRHLNPFATSSIDYYVMTSGGTGYSEYNPPSITITGSGSGATAQAVVVGGSVQALVPIQQGSGYTTATVTITAGGSGTGFAATAVSNSAGTWDGGGTVEGTVTITNTGSGYTSGVIITAQYPLFGSTQTVVALSSTVTGGHIAAVQFPYTAEGQKPVYTDVTISVPTGSGATATAHIGPSTGTYPSCVAYFQQRRFYANTTNQPDTYFASQVGAFNNMDRSIPTVDSDAIVGTPWAQQVNGIQEMVPMPGGLVVLTGLGSWQLNGGSAGSAVTPTSQTATPQAYNGIAPLVRAIPINYDILYVQEKGSIVRDLNYNFFTNIYTGLDLTVLSNHLFTGHTIERWDWAEEPYKLVWAVRDDGVLLSLTYLKLPTAGGQQAPDSDIYSWARHDTQGLFQSVACVTEPPVDAPYFVVKRKLGT